MKYVITIITMCFSLNAGAQQVNKIIDNDKINQVLEVDNSDNNNKEQLALNMYKQRLNLLSYKERQLKVYENSLNGMKMQLEILQTDMENKQNLLNEKEIVLLKKELQLKEKESDLKQLEEKLSQIDNIQLIRNNTKPSMPSVVVSDKKTETLSELEKSSKRKVRDYVKVIKTASNKVPQKSNNVLPNNSGLGEMTKDMVNGVNVLNDINEK